MASSIALEKNRAVAPAPAAAPVPAPLARAPALVTPLGTTQRNVAVGTSVSPLAAGLTQPKPSADAVSRAFDTIAVPEAHGAQLRSSPTNNGSWLAAWHIMDSARDHIDASYFIFNRDVFGRAFLGQLLRKQRDGVQVHLLLDASGDTFGSHGFTSTLRGQDYLQELVAAGAKISIYNPLFIKIPKQIADLASANIISANHDKIVATERYAMTGGRNVASHYFTSPKDNPDVYRDNDVVIDSPVAAQRLSRAVMSEMDRRDLTMPIQADAFDWNISPRDAELLATADMMDAWLVRPPFSENEKKKLRTDQPGRDALADRLIAEAIAKAHAQRRAVPSRSALVDSARELTTNLELAGSGRGYDLDAGMQPGDVKIIDRTSVASGALGHDEIAPGLAAIIDAAQHHLIITNPYVVLNETVREKLEAAGKRGVRIDLLTNSPASTDSAVTQAFFLNEWPQLLARIPNMHVYVFAGSHKLHAKTGVADSEIAAIGSFNLDIISSDINGEGIALTRSSAVAKDLEASFADDLADPENNVLEYTIKRDARGTPILENGQPIVTFGPENHVGRKAMRLYRAISAIANYAAKRLPQLSPLTESQPMTEP